MKTTCRKSLLKGHQLPGLRSPASYTSSHRISSIHALSTFPVPRARPQPRISDKAKPTSSSYRTYFSQDRHEPPPFSTTESAILSSALSHVSTHGFSNTALLNGARDEGYPEVSINLFPRGTFDLIVYYLVTQRLALRDAVQFPAEGKQLGVGAKVRSLALHRLQANHFAIHHWQQVS